MNLALDWTVPENVSPFVFLPILPRCEVCREAELPLMVERVIIAGHPYDVCRLCADVAYSMCTHPA